MTDLRKDLCPNCRREQAIKIVGFPDDVSQLANMVVMLLCDTPLDWELEEERVTHTPSGLVVAFDIDTPWVEAPHFQHFLPRDDPKVMEAIKGLRIEKIALPTVQALQDAERKRQEDSGSAADVSDKTTTVTQRHLRIMGYLK